MPPENHALLYGNGLLFDLGALGAGDSAAKGINASDGDGMVDLNAAISLHPDKYDVLPTGAFTMARGAPSSSIR